MLAIDGATGGTLSTKIFMPQNISVPLLASALVALALGSPAGAQQDTTKAEVMAGAAQSAAGVRAQIRSSGMSPQQIRERLRAKGLNESILDEYISGAAGGQGAASLAPSRDVLAAITVLGQADQKEQDAATRRPVEGSRAATPTSIDGLEVFGMNVFKRSTNQFEPNLAGPVDQNYRLGPLDVLAIITSGQVEVAHSLEVTRGGYVVVPQVGQVYVANLTLGQATTAIVNGLRRVYEGAGTAPGSPTRVSLNVARLRTNQIFVIGEVDTPGSFQVSAAGTALSALYAAGGPTVNGSMRKVEIRRGGAVVDTFDMYDYLLRGDASHDARLDNGDVVFVPPNPTHVAITGEVMRPAWYELKNGETLADLVATAGSYRPTASRTRLEISRFLPPAERTPSRERVQFDVKGPELAQGTAPRTALRDGDRVNVLAITSPLRDVVSVSGNVWAPGQLGLEPGMRLSEALRTAGGLKPGSYLDEVVITRTLPDKSLQLIRAQLMDSLGSSNPDIALQDADSIRVYAREEFRPARFVTIGGAVNKGIAIPFSEGMTLRQAILAAGGLRESAYLPEVEVMRLPVDRSNGALGQVIRVPLDSSYLFEIGPDGEYLGPPGIPARTSKAEEVALKPYDRVNVLEQTGFSLGGSIVLGGEIRFPGVYGITSRDERLSDVIARAGGLTPLAHPDGAVFRRSISPSDSANRAKLLSRVSLDRAYAISIDQLSTTSRTSGAPVQAASDVVAAQESLRATLYAGEEQTDRIAIDLSGILRQRAHGDNFIVQDGDKLTIPQINPIVTVRGFVNSPSVLPWREGATLSDYVAGAGGVTTNGDLRKTFVQQPNGRVEQVRIRRLRPDGEPIPRPGAVIVVAPEETRRSFKFPTQAVLTGLATLATTILAIVSLSK